MIKEWPDGDDRYATLGGYATRQYLHVQDEGGLNEIRSRLFAMVDGDQVSVEVTATTRFSSAGGRVAVKLTPELCDQLADAMEEFGTRDWRPDGDGAYTAFPAQSVPLADISAASLLVVGHPDGKVRLVALYGALSSTAVLTGEEASAFAGELDQVASTARKQGQSV